MSHGLVHGLGSIAIVAAAITLVACEDGPRAAPRPAIVLAERGVALPPGAVAAIGVQLQGLSDVPLRLSFDPLASPGSMRGKVRRTSAERAILELTTSRALAPGVHDALVVGTAAGVRLVAPLQIQVVPPPLLARERRPVEVGDLGYDAIARARLR